MEKVVFNANKDLLNLKDIGSNAGENMMRNFSNEFNHLIHKFNSALNYNNEAKMNVYSKIEIELRLYFKMFNGTKILKNVIDKMEAIYNEIQLFKSKLYPGIYDYESDKFENAFYWKSFK